MPRLRLIHWNAAEAAARVAALQAAGHRVDYELPEPGTLRGLFADPPEAVVIDLGRLPSHGRDVALGLRGHRATRHVPLVFVGGAPEKVERVRQSLPDAVYTTWAEFEPALAHALANPPQNPVVPRDRLAGYSGTPLPKKLGIKEGTVVALLDAPEGFEATLGELPGGAVVRRGEAEGADLLLWFPASRAVLEAEVRRMETVTGPGGIWICWPKKASGIVSDLSETVVRAAGLENQLVDYKIAAIDSTWSGLKFARRPAR